ncbi:MULTISPECIES: hypothetical protein [Halorussus]|uniref:hypothetical protein n=1 Tax=Halorussus TaxID=1070314 RepID=UPI000E2114DB|nr:MULTISPECIES: hypothetical protein [Halorussus]NHN57916.1 hypothetical protein [Halorussus sp. JP-T4]
MRRRDVLRNCAALGAAAGVGSLAGCAGGGDDESKSAASLSQTSFDRRESESGDLVVTVTIENTGTEAGTGDLYVTVTAAEPSSGNETDDDGTVASRESRDVTVPAGESKTVEIEFDIPYEQFREQGSIDIDFRP